jgi:hypothetical protein
VLAHSEVARAGVGARRSAISGTTAYAGSARSCFSATTFLCAHARAADGGAGSKGDARPPLERRYCGWANSFPTPCPIDADETETISYHTWQAMLRKRGEDGGPDYYAEELVPIWATRAQFITAVQGFVTTYLAHVWECRAMRQGLEMFEANKDGVTATKLSDYAAQVRARRCALRALRAHARVALVRFLPRYFRYFRVAQ